MLADLLACASPTEAESKARREAHGESDADTDADTDSDADSDADTDSDADSEAVLDCATPTFSINEDAPSDTTIPDLAVAMTGIPSGTFCMGSEDAEAYPEEAPVHMVTLTHPFWIGTTEFTQTQYVAARGKSPSRNEGCDDCPVEWVTWYDAAVLANALSEAEGLEACYSPGPEPDPADGYPYDCGGYRLPTEAEWEYAALAGNYTRYAGSDDADEVAWTSANSGGYTQPVCGLGLNAWGLCDMSGNVYEWTGDAHGYYTAEAQTDPVAAGGNSLVVRGGCMEVDPLLARASARSSGEPYARGSNLGLRLVRTSQ